MLKKIEDFIYKVGEQLCIVFLLLMVIIVCITVFGRFVLNNTPAWGDETAIACMVWFGLVSSALAERDNSHIRVSVLDNIYPKKLVRIFHLITYILKLFFAGIICWNSIRLVIFNRKVFMASVHISESWVSLAGTVMGIMMFAFLLFKIKKEIFNK